MANEIEVVNGLSGIPNIKAFYTTRLGGFSTGAYEGLNLGLHVGDSEEIVHKNRNLLLENLFPKETTISWMEQTHSVEVLPAIKDSQKPLKSDAQYTTEKHLALAIMTADCLPVLFSSSDGSWIAVAHAGWRGLLNGVLENTVLKYPNDPKNLCAWVGPAIDFDSFQIGAEVREAFLKVNPDFAEFFKEDTQNPGKFYGDLPRIAFSRLAKLGITKITLSNLSTYKDKEKFYSYRRDGITGRGAGFIVKL